jgi:diguanylate cyclase (GGDEF)-like protein
MSRPPKPDQAHANAAILVWQSRYRLLLIVAAGLGTLGLRWAGTLPEASIIVSRVGEGTALLLTAALIAAYFVFIAVLTVWLRRVREVGRWAVAATLTADIIALHGIVILASPPEWYERSLILSTFTLQLTMLYFGWRDAAWNLLGVVGAYFAMIVTASVADPTFSVVESLWTLALFTMAVTAFLSLQADLGDRLANIVQVFDRAREGDFSLTFEEETDTQPDRITVIGAAYDKMRTQLTSVILTDPLTECYNARGFDQLVAREISRAVRSDATLAMLGVDIDFFKEVNDRYGHLVGDDVLREVGAVLRQTARLSDVVARTGGEEFSILAPDTDEHGAILFANRILEAFRTRKFAHLGDRVLTVSIGVAVAQARADGVARLLRIRSDEALYVAKRGGRNRVEAWREGKATRASQMNLRAISE